MLNLYKKSGQSLVIGDGPQAVRVTVLKVGRNRVSLGFETADKTVKIKRVELCNNVTALKPMR